MEWTGQGDEIITHGDPAKIHDDTKNGFSYSNIQTPPPSFVAEGSDPSAIYQTGANAPDLDIVSHMEDNITSHADSTSNKGVDAPNAEQPVHIDTPVDDMETEDAFDREAVMKAINDTGLLTFNVRNVQITKYLPSIYKMARLLTQSGLYPSAIKDVISDVVQMILDYIDTLIKDGLYDELVDQARQFKLTAQIYDVFGESVDNYYQHDLFSSTDTDIERQFRLAETKLGNQGIGHEYGRLYYDEADPNAFRIDVILFSADNDCIGRLNTYAENKFHQLNDDYRRYMITVDERYRSQYDSIVSDGDVISKHNFRLPETISLPHETGGKNYSDHLFVNQDRIAHFKLNGWEEGVLIEEQKRPDYVCWLRNPPRKPWSLCIPYIIGTDHKSAYPDFLIIRKDALIGYVIDILEPHNPDLDDNLGKAQGFAEYARQNPQIGRIQLIRKGKDPAGNLRFRRLDLSKGSIRDKVMHATTNSELDHIFETDGIF